ncbi:hypothetical protein CIK05_00780 [Bdellovibrio sp. qaytius]|nr:hypothetical protein CIK05_00780 [Bdellovibrio sp. qaytius]
MSSKSTAQPPLRNNSAFSGRTLLFVGLAMIAIYFLTMVVYPMIFNSERNRSNSLLHQPIIPPPIK